MQPWCYSEVVSTSRGSNEGSAEPTETRLATAESAVRPLSVAELAAYVTLMGMVYSATASRIESLNSGKESYIVVAGLFSFTLAAGSIALVDGRKRRQVLPGAIVASLVWSACTALALCAAPIDDCPIWLANVPFVGGWACASLRSNFRFRTAASFLIVGTLIAFLVVVPVAPFLDRTR